MAWKRELVDWLTSIVYIGGVTLFLYVFVVAPYVVEGKSMEATLLDRERVIVNKAIYYTSTPQRDDIVIIHPVDGENWIKRVVAIAGDTVQAKDDQLYINGQPVPEAYLVPKKLTTAAAGITLTESFGPLTVPPDSVFVLGDNRNNSTDSRVIGPVNLKQVVGRAEAIYWPLTHVRLPK